MKKIVSLLCALLMAISCMCSASAKTLSHEEMVSAINQQFYSDIIEDLQPGQAYAFASITGGHFDALIVTDKANIAKDGTVTANEGTIYCTDLSGRVQWYGRAYSDAPLTVGQKHVLFTLLKTEITTEITKCKIDIFSGDFITMECASKMQDASKKTQYYYFCPEKQNVNELSSDSRPYDRLAKEYKDSAPIEFTLVK